MHDGSSRICFRHFHTADRIAVLHSSIILSGVPAPGRDMARANKRTADGTRRDRRRTTGPDSLLSVCALDVCALRLAPRDVLDMRAIATRLRVQPECLDRAEYVRALLTVISTMPARVADARRDAFAKLATCCTSFDCTASTIREIDRCGGTASRRWNTEPASQRIVLQSSRVSPKVFQCTDIVHLELE